MLKKDLVEKKWLIDGNNNAEDLIDFWKIKNKSFTSVSKILNIIFSKDEDREYADFWKDNILSSVFKSFIFIFSHKYANSL